MRDAPFYAEHDRGGRRRLDNAFGGWSFYVFYAQPFRECRFVKVGVSTLAFERLVQVRQGCPFEMERARTAYIGVKSVAHRLESEVKTAMRPYRTRGEWFAFDAADSTAETLLADAIRTAYAASFYEPIVWNEVTVEAIKQFHAEARAKLERQKAADSRPKPRLIFGRGK